MKKNNTGGPSTMKKSITSAVLLTLKRITRAVSRGKVRDYSTFKGFFNLVAFSILFASNGQSWNACAKQLPNSGICCYKKDQSPSECCLLSDIREYSRTMDLICQVPLSNRQIIGLVFLTASSRRINTEAEIVADENNQEYYSLVFTAIPIVISSGSEDDSDDDTAYEEAERQRKGKMVVSASKAEPKRKGRVAAPEIPGIVIREQENGKFVNPESESESDSEDDAEYQRQLNVAKLESLNTQNMEAPEPSEAEQRSKGKAAEHDISLGAEYKRQLKFAIQESLKSYYNNSAGRSLDAHALRTETGLARGNIGNEDSVDEGAQTEALDAVRGNESPKGKRKIKDKKQTIAEPDVARGNFINSSRDNEPTSSMPRQRVSSRGRVLKPTSKLLQLGNVTDARADEGTSGSERKQPKKHLSSNVIARARLMPRIPVGVVDGSEDAPLPSNRGPRRSFRQHGSQHNRLQSGVAGASEPTGSVSVVSQAGQANGVAQADVVNPHGSGVGGEVGGSEPDADYWITRKC
ncbi:hypothetical protein Tco_0877731 [Tanacetum coccineum]|uniref:Uncharacterized protein n=1 Tax=Tanacetum coccineum TaxID=301880 RepID=A0ABQ5BW01_9ASTR